MTPLEMDRLDAASKAAYYAAAERGYCPEACAAAAIVAAYRAGQESNALEVQRLTAEVERLRSVLEDLSCDGCEYGDNCPTFGSNHYQCIPCKCKAALEASHDEPIGRSDAEYAGLLDALEASHVDE